MKTNRMSRPKPDYHRTRTVNNNSIQTNLKCHKQSINSNEESDNGQRDFGKIKSLAQ